MINSIEMKNWKTHEDTKIEFSKGTNILIGAMGAGKSSTIDAICYGLFGTFPAVKQKRVKLSEIVKNRPNQENGAVVKITFTAQGDIYAVEREISLNGGGKARLTKNGEYLQSQPERVNEEVEKILKVDYDLFARAVYSEQNRLDYFLELKAKDRKDQMDELLGLDKFALASDNAGSLINKVKDIINNQKKDASQLDVESVKNRLSGLRLECEKLEADKEKLTAELILSNSSIKSLELQINEMSRLEAKKNILAMKIAELKSKMEYALIEAKKIEEKNLGTKESIESAIKTVEIALGETIEKEKGMADSERGSQTLFSKIDSEIQQLEKRRFERDAILKKVAGRDVHKLENEYDILVKGVQVLETELLTDVSEMKNSKKWLDDLKVHIGKCPVCERDMEKELQDKLILQKEKTMLELSKKIKTAESNLAQKKSEMQSKFEAVNELKVLSSRIKDYENVDKSIEENIVQREKTRAVLGSLRLEIDRVKKDVEKMTAHIAELSKAKEELGRREGYLKDILAFDEMRKFREAEFDKIKVDVQEIERLRVHFVDARSKASMLSAQIEAHVRYIDDKKAQIKDKEAQIDTIERMNRDVKQKEFAMHNLAKFKASLDETKLVLRSRLVKSINDVMQEMWLDMYPYGDYKSIMLEATPDDYILNVLVSRNGEDVWQEVEGIASGGERSIACLALRVAFSMVLVPNLKWIILDEPTHNIDEDGIRRFVDLFNNQLPKIVDQIFIITHDELLKQSVNSNIYVLARNKGESGSTVVERA